MAGNAIAVILFLLIGVSAAPNGRELDEISLATRTLQSVAVFDGRVLAPVAGGRLLFRVRRVYKGWHRQNVEPEDRRRVIRLNSPDDHRLVYVSCRSANFRGLTDVVHQDAVFRENSRSKKVQSRYFPCE